MSWKKAMFKSTAMAIFLVSALNFKQVFHNLFKLLKKSVISNFYENYSKFLSVSSLRVGNLADKYQNVDVQRLTY